MKYLKIYESENNLLDDLEDLTIHKKLMGWWISEISEYEILHICIFARDFENAKRLFLINSVFTGETEEYENDIEYTGKLKDWKEVFNYYLEAFDDGGSLCIWEMKPRNRRGEEEIEYLRQERDLPKIVDFGRKVFLDFDEILDKYPEGQNL